MCIHFAFSQNTFLSLSLSLCHVTGVNRYSIASCLTLLEEGAPCRPNNQPTDTVVSYPTGDSVNLTNVYFTMCGCAAELTCVEGTCVRNPLKVQPQQ
jgi:hypothetical protein